jgi:arabinosaccharide transport system substrate-binding protein
MRFRGLPLGFALSPGALVMLILAVCSGAAILTLDSKKQSGELSMWTFAQPHYDIYVPEVGAWNTSGEPVVDMHLIGRQVMDRRMLGGFLGDVPTADLIEAERSTASLAFAGPLDAVGFVDITDRLDAEGLLDSINPPSLSPWTYEGRVFGVPHDVHPVMLAYRADITEAAGIDMDAVQTWDDLFRVLSPLQQHTDRGDPMDRYVLSLSASESDMLETLLLQADGGAFTETGTLAIARDVNVTAVANMVSWMIGPGRVATHVPEFSPTGDQLKLEGHALCYLMPDWMCNVWRRNVPTLEGKVKLIPLPAWEAGGRRTSVWGGSMLGIARTSANQDAAWEFAKHLYLSEELALQLYRAGDIITPIQEHWDNPIFDEPDVYFSGQRKGRMFIDLAPDVPLRAASPYFKQARGAVQNAVSRTHDEADKLKLYTADAIEPIARKHLQQAHAEVLAIINGNAFLRENADTGEQQ